MEPGYRISRREVDALTVPMFPIFVLSSTVSPACIPEDGFIEVSKIYKFGRPSTVKE
jgi:hypothetical protein